MPKALFLDRDGTINVDYGYVFQKENFEFIPGIFELCQLAQQYQYLIIVITNQSGIQRGIFNEKDLTNINNYMTEKFAQKKITITDIFYCPYLSGPNRKPNPGLFLEAQKKYNIDMSASLSLGDKLSDTQAAQTAGVGHCFTFSGNYNEVIHYLKTTA